jgi:hypothetical protein
MPVVNFGPSNPEGDHEMGREKALPVVLVHLSACAKSKIHLICVKWPPFFNEYHPVSFCFTDK